MSADSPAKLRPAEAAFLRNVLMRGAALIESKWPLRAPDPHYVEFPFKRSPEETEVWYRAVPHFFPSVVKVYAARSGIQLCQSVEGNPFELDGETFDLCVDNER